jgi:hypothetical protein
MIVLQKSVRNIGFLRKKPKTGETLRKFFIINIDPRHCFTLNSGTEYLGIRVILTTFNFSVCHRGDWSNGSLYMYVHAHTYMSHILRYDTNLHYDMIWYVISKTHYAYPYICVWGVGGVVAKALEGSVAKNTYLESWHSYGTKGFVIFRESSKFWFHQRHSFIKWSLVCLNICRDVYDIADSRRRYSTAARTRQVIRKMY